VKRKRSPQEKKLLSYAYDGRNTYGESRTSSRKSIAKRKALANRALRRAENVAIAPSVNDENSDAFVPRVGKKSWRKFPDAPLAEYVGRSLSRRKTQGMNSTPKRSALLKKGKAIAAKRGTRYKGPLQNDSDG
jgi:hypothetical protein